MGVSTKTSSKGESELSKAEENQLDETLANLSGEAQFDMISRVDVLYAKACEANKKRAQRFGTEYKPPNRYVILRDELKRERQNPTAIKEELRKLKEREMKYNISSNNNGDQVETQGEADDDMDDFFLLGGSQNNKKQGNGKTTIALGGGIQALQYKTEEEKLQEEEKRKKRQERFHFSDPTAEQDEDGQSKEEKDQPPESIFCSTKLNGKYIYQVDDNRTDFLLDDQYCKRVYNKIHLYAIDTREFLTIRTIDVMNLFHAYNPTYVEWLGSKSCNIEFNNNEDASNALKSLSVPAPSTRQMLVEMKETLDYAKKMKAERKRLAKLGKSKLKKKGRITTQAQLDEMMGIESKTPKEHISSQEGKGESTTGDYQSNNSNNDHLEIQNSRNEPEVEDEEDGNEATEEMEFENEDNFRNLALYGWHIGVSPIIKIYNDEYGAKGTSVRVLLRYATTSDLYKNPSEKRKRTYKYKKKYYH